MAEENDSEKLGMVVFGVGIAGRVRIRDLKDPEYQDGGWKLVGFVSRYNNPFPTIHKFCYLHSLLLYWKQYGSRSGFVMFASLIKLVWSALGYITYAADIVSR